jgi:hypothetical protein
MRCAKEISKEFGNEREIAGERSSMKDGLVAGRPRVETAPDILDSFGQRARVSPTCTLEHHVFHKMRKTAEMLGFGSRSDACIEAHCDGLSARDRVNGNRKSIAKDMLVAAHLPSSRHLPLSASP